MSYKMAAERDRRLIVLRALAGENDGRINEKLMQTELERFGHYLSRVEVQQLFEWLEGVDAIKVHYPGGVMMVAEITAKGEDHVRRRGQPIDGIDLPSRVG